MALERVFAQGEQEEVPPLVVGPGGEIQTKRHEGPNVLDGDGLGVEVEEGHNFVEEEDVAKGLVIATSRATTIDRRSGSSGAFLGARSSARRARLAVASQSFSVVAPLVPLRGRGGGLHRGGPGQHRPLHEGGLPLRRPRRLGQWWRRAHVWR